jgi:hypothetical protein
MPYVGTKRGRGSSGKTHSWSRRARAASVYEAAGEPAVVRLFDTFRLDKDALTTLLADAVDPTLAAFARVF